MTVEDNKYEEDAIVDKTSNNEDDEEIPSAIGEGITEKNSPVRNNTCPQRSSESREIQ